MKKKYLLMLILQAGISFCAFSQLTFQKHFGTSTHNTGYFVQQTFDGGYILANTKKPNGGKDGIALVKVNSAGDTAWTRAFADTIDYTWMSAQQTADSGFIILGYLTSGGFGSEDMFLIKTDASGNITWSKTYGGNDIDLSASVLQTYDGGFVLTGYTESFGSGQRDMLFIKTDPNGNPLISKTYGSINSDYVYNIKQTADSGYILTGRFGNGNMSCLVKTDTGGNVSWIKTYQEMSLTGSAGYSVLQTTDGGYLFAGYTYDLTTGLLYVVRTDAVGDTLWTRVIGGGANFDVAHCVQKTFDDEYIIGGYTSSYGAGSADMLLIKMDDNGNISWSKAYGDINSDVGKWVQQTADSGYVLAGYSYASLSTLGMFLVKTDVNGSTPCNVISINPAIVHKTINVNVPVITTTSPSVITSSIAFPVSSGDTVVSVCNSLSVAEPDFTNSFDLFPNPSRGEFTILFHNQIRNGTMKVINIVGDNIYTKNIFNESKMEINLKNVSSGIYFVKVFDGEKYYTRKLIVERD